MYTARQRAESRCARTPSPVCTHQGDARDDFRVCHDQGRIGEETHEDVNQRVAREAQQHLGVLLPLLVLLASRIVGPRQLQARVELLDLGDEAAAEAAVPDDGGGQHEDVEEEHAGGDATVQHEVAVVQPVAVGSQRPEHGRGEVREAEPDEDVEPHEEQLGARGAEVGVHEQEALRGWGGAVGSEVSLLESRTPVWAWRAIKMNIPPRSRKRRPSGRWPRGKQGRC